MMEISLDQIGVATPCSAAWDEMTGDERVRRCSHCQLNVYNLSGMSREEAETLVRESEGSICVRFYRRDDGTLLTRDCPVGVRAYFRRQVSRLVATGAAVVAMIGAGCAFTRNSSTPEPAADSPLGQFTEWVEPTAAVPAIAPPPRQAMMGKMICQPAPLPNPAPAPQPVPSQDASE